MKMKILIVAILAIIPALQVVRADSLVPDSISVTGNIIQRTGTNGATRVLPITIANVLKVLGVTKAPPVATLRYYTDDTTDAIVIAPRILALTGSGTPIATLGGRSQGGVSWNPNKHSVLGSGEIAALNGNLSGTAYLTGVYPLNTETDTIRFFSFGQIKGVPTIVNGTIVDIYPLKGEYK